MKRRMSIILVLGMILTLGAARGAGEEVPDPRIVFKSCDDPGAMTVHVSSNVARARLYVDGSLRGQTPAKACLGAGKHELRVAGAGYVDETVSLETLVGSEVVLTVELEEGLSAAGQQELFIRGVAVAWALEGIKNDATCRRALDKYGQDFGGLSPEAREVIEETYRSLMGECSNDDPPRASRDKARNFLRGVEVNW